MEDTSQECLMVSECIACNTQLETIHTEPFCTVLRDAFLLPPTTTSAPTTAPPPNTHDMPSRNATVLFILQAALVFAWGFLAEYSTPDSDETAVSPLTYSLFIHVGLMVFPGFGLLMAAPKNFSVGTPALIYIVAALAVQCTMLFHGMWLRVFDYEAWDAIVLDLTSAIHGLIGAATVLIGLGVVHGRLTIIQMAFFAVTCTFFATLNEIILVDVLDVVDTGGSLVVHAFGGLYGLAFLCAMPRSKARPISSAALESATGFVYTDTVAFIGSMFLFVLWPSFNGGFSEGAVLHRVILNTFFASMAAVLTSAAFFSSDDKLNIWAMQNSVLSGALGIGSAAAAVKSPAAAAGIGVIAALGCFLGYRFLNRILVARGLLDTCGAFFLHGVVGLLAGLISVVVARVESDSKLGGFPITDVYPEREPDGDHTAAGQAKAQLAGIAITIVLSFASGILSSAILYSKSRPLSIDLSFLSTTFMNE